MGMEARQPDWERFSALAEANYCAYVVTLPGTEVADSPACLRVRTTIPFAYLNAVVCRDLPTGAALDALIAETRADYAAHGSPHSWYVTPFTIPADAGETLAARGLVRQEQANMAIDLADLPEAAPVPADCTIEEVYGAERFDEWGRTYVTGYGDAPGDGGGRARDTAGDAVRAGHAAAAVSGAAGRDGGGLGDTVHGRRGGGDLQRGDAARGAGAGDRGGGDAGGAAGGAKTGGDGRGAARVGDGVLGLSADGIRGVLRLGLLPRAAVCVAVMVPCRRMRVASRSHPSSRSPTAIRLCLEKGPHTFGAPYRRHGHAPFFRSGIFQVLPLPFKRSFRVGPLF